MIKNIHGQHSLPAEAVTASHDHRCLSCDMKHKRQSVSVVRSELGALFMTFQQRQKLKQSTRLLIVNAVTQDRFTIISCRYEHHVPERNKTKLHTWARG